jgi:hypothetical protein
MRFRFYSMIGNTMTPERLAEFAKRLQYGMPLSVGEQRELMEHIEWAHERLGMLYGRLAITELRRDYEKVSADHHSISLAAHIPPRRKRCEACGGEGGFISIELPPGDTQWATCDDCHGSGYQENANASDTSGHVGGSEHATH